MVDTSDTVRKPSSSSAVWSRRTKSALEFMTAMRGPEPCDDRDMDMTSVCCVATPRSSSPSAESRHRATEEREGRATRKEYTPFLVGAVLRSRDLSLSKCHT